MLGKDAGLGTKTETLSEQQERQQTSKFDS